MASFASRFAAAYAAQTGTALVETKTAVPAPISATASPLFSAAALSPQQITPHVAWLWYQNVSTFAKVVDVIADAVANLTPIVQVDGEAQPDHPVMALLKRPGFNRNRKRFIKELAVQQLVTGTGYIHAIGNTEAPPVALDVLKSRWLWHMPDFDMWPKQFIYSEGTRSIRFNRDTNPRDPRYVDDSTTMPGPMGDVALGELVPVYDMDGDWKGIGLPRLNAVKLDVELRLKGIQHNASVLDKGARLSGVVSYKDSLTPEQAAAIEQQFQALVSGVGNAGKVLVTAGGEFDFAQLSQSMKDMDFAKLIGIVEDAIVSRYNVPVTLFRTDAQTQNNYETAWNVLYDQAVLPTFQTVYSGISAMLSRRLGYEVEIVHDALTSPILARQAVARARELLGASMITRNEARSIVGYEPVLGGDLIMGPMGMVEQGQDLFTGIEEVDAENQRRAAEKKPKTEGEAEDDEETATVSKPKPKKPAPDKTETEKAANTIKSFAGLIARFAPALH